MPWFLFSFTCCKWHKQWTVIKEMRQEDTGRKQQHCDIAASYDKAIFQQQVRTKAAAKMQQSTENACNSTSAAKVSGQH